MAINSADSDRLKDLFNALPDNAQGGVNDSASYVNRAAGKEMDSVANLMQFVEWAP